jgi:hypothetical protein
VHRRKAERFLPYSTIPGATNVPELFYSLAVLACPVGMGLMMWLMMRGNKSHGQARSGSDAEIAALRAQLDQLRAAQRDRDAAPAAGPTDTP